jgi:DNA ligase-1
VWHGLSPPFTELFDWAEGRAGQPTARDVPIFRPFMLAHPLEETKVSLDDYAAEWKWDGIRVQLVHAAGQTRLYSRTGDDISMSFPDVAEAFRERGVLDGELLVRGSDQGMTDIRGGGGGKLQRTPAAAGPEECQPEDAGRLPRFRPALRHIVRRR